MFWFMQKKFLGSYFFLMAIRRSWLGPNAALIVSSPSSPRKFNGYAPLEKGRIASAKQRAHSIWRWESPASTHCARMPTEYSAGRWEKDVRETPPHLAAPP